MLIAYLLLYKTDLGVCYSLQRIAIILLYLRLSYYILVMLGVVAIPIYSIID